MQGDEESIRRKAYELWEGEGRPEGRHDEHWRQARESVQTKSGDARAAEATPQTNPEELHEQDKAMTPQNGAERLTQTTEPEKPAVPTPPTKRPRTQRKKTPAA